MFRHLSLLFLICGMVLLSACTVWPERPATEFSQALGGEELERVFWKEIKAKHWDEVERRIASNFVSINAEGQHDRAATLERLKQLELKDYSLGDFQTELNGNTFVVAYTIILHGTRNGQPLPEEPQRVLTVWQQQVKGWVEIAHSTLAQAPK
jgi:hypothetical protein